MLTTTRLLIETPEDEDGVDLETHLRNFALKVDLASIDDQGPLANRPVSTVPSPGLTGRYFTATDEGPGPSRHLYRDYGTGYDEIPLLRSGDLYVGPIDMAGTYTASGVRIDNSGFIEAVGASSIGNFLTSAVEDEAQTRFAIRRDGRLQWWGAGLPTSDVDLYRDAVDVLKSGDTFKSTLDVWARDGDASQVIMGATGVGAGFRFGTALDTNLYRSTTTTLRTDSSFVVMGGAQPVAASNGTFAPAALNVTGAKGGNATGSTGQAGGQGGNILLTGGAGGNAPAGSSNGTGGDISLYPGAPGSGAGGAGSRGTIRLGSSTTDRIAFFGSGTGYPKQNVSGSRGGNAALANFLTALHNLGLINDITGA